MTTGEADSASDLDFNLGLLAYGLLFFAIFLGGLPAFNRGRHRLCAPPWIASHHNF